MVYPNIFTQDRLDQEAFSVAVSRLYVSAADISKISKGLSTSRANQYELYLSNRVLRDAVGLHEPVAELMNVMLRQCTVPDRLKRSRVAPVQVVK